MVEKSKNEENLSIIGNATISCIFLGVVYLYPASCPSLLLPIQQYPGSGFAGGPQHIGQALEPWATPGKVGFGYGGKCPVTQGLCAVIWHLRSCV